jgi:hypothetical protein
LSKLRLVLALCIVVFSVGAIAQNTFPSSGNVGIGTANPQYLLQLVGSGGAQIFTYLNNPGTNAVGSVVNQSPASSTSGKSEQFQWYFNEDSIHVPVRALTLYQYPSDSLGGANHMHAFFGIDSSGNNIQYFSGNVGIATTAPAYPLDVAGQIHTSAGIVFPDHTVQVSAFTPALCGGDYAESVDVSGSRTNYQPGDVLVIDPSSPGKFLKSNEPYSTLVAGIYSTKPGYVGRRQTTPKNSDEVPMAMWSARRFLYQFQ